MGANPDCGWGRCERPEEVGSTQPGVPTGASWRHDTQTGSRRRHGVSLCFGFCLICRDPSSDSIRALVLRTGLEMGHTYFIFKMGFSTNPPERPPCVLKRVKSLLCTSTALGVLPLITGLTPVFRLTSELQQVGSASRAQHGAHPAAHRPATT